MIKFFRKIRQKLLNENKFSKYLIYALGEIILVVIGILIALSINNWNDVRKDQKIESNYLSGLRKELIADTTSISLYLIKNHQEKIDILKLAKKYNRAIQKIRDTTIFVENLNKIMGPWKFTWTLNTNIYNELESTGNLRKIRDRKLRQEISKYYSRLAMVQNISDKSESGFRSFIKANLYYDTELDKLESDIDYRQFLNKLKEDSFYELCNLELSHAQVMYYWAKQVKERGIILLEMLDEYSIN
jgi:hypothetical protein